MEVSFLSEAPSFRSVSGEKAKEQLELLVGLTWLNITARWRGPRVMEMHTSRVVPSAWLSSSPGEIL